jgi:hypothetical protein
VDDLDAPADVWPAQAAEVGLDVCGEVAREGGEQDAVVGLGEHLLREVDGAVHGDHGLARAGAAEHPNRAVPGPVDELALARVEEDPPLLQRRVEHGLERFVVVDGHEAALGRFALLISLR